MLFDLAIPTFLLGIALLAFIRKEVRFPRKTFQEAEILLDASQTKIASLDAEKNNSRALLKYYWSARIIKILVGGFLVFSFINLVSIVGSAFSSTPLDPASPEGEESVARISISAPRSPHHDETYVVEAGVAITQPEPNQIFVKNFNTPLRGVNYFSVTSRGQIEELPSVTWTAISGLLAILFGLALLAYSSVLREDEG